MKCFDPLFPVFSLYRLVNNVTWEQIESVQHLSLEGLYLKIICSVSWPEVFPEHTNSTQLTSVQHTLQLQFTETRLAHRDGLLYILMFTYTEELALRCCFPVITQVLFARPTTTFPTGLGCCVSCRKMLNASCNVCANVPNIQMGSLP